MYLPPFPYFGLRNNTCFCVQKVKTLCTSVMVSQVLLHEEQYQTHDDRKNAPLDYYIRPLLPFCNQYVIHENDDKILILSLHYRVNMNQGHKIERSES